MIPSQYLILLLRFLLHLGVLIVSTSVIAQVQQPLVVPDNDTTSNDFIQIDYAELFQNIDLDTAMVRRLAGKVELRHDSVFIYCNEATITNDSLVVAKGEVVIYQNDTTSTFADSLIYSSNSEVARLFGEVVLVSGKQQLFTDSLTYDLENKIATYTSGAKLTNGEAQLSSLKGQYDVDRAFITFKDSVFVVKEDFNLRADTLQFDTRSRIVFFNGPTAMATPESRVYCEHGYYNMLDSSGVFSRNAQVAREDTRAVADSIFYEGKKNEFRLIGNAKFRDKTKSAAADQILYNEKLNYSTLIGNAYFSDKTQNISGDKIEYDGKTKAFKSSGGITIIDKGNKLVADSIWFDDATGMAKVSGNVLFIDTIENRTIQANQIDYNSENDYVLAYGGRPLVSILVDKDTLFLSADTLLTYKRPNGQDSISLDSLQGDLNLTTVDTAITTIDFDSLSVIVDSVRFITAYRDVRIYKSDMQAVSDSLSFNSLDSIFKLFYDPIVWADTSQFFSDTISLVMKDKNLDRIMLNSNAMMINPSEGELYNQVKGRNVMITFDSSQVKQMNVIGNAESIYYAQDEKKAYVGVNHVKSASMRMLFSEQKLKDIYFYDSPSGNLAPLAPIQGSPLKLEGFKWFIDKQPKSLNDLLLINNSQELTKSVEKKDGN